MLSIRNFADQCGIEPSLRPLPDGSFLFSLSFKGHAALIRNSRGWGKSAPIGNGETPAAARRDYIRQIRGKTIELTSEFSDESGIAISVPTSVTSSQFEFLHLPARPKKS